ncbi:MAG: septum formation initiator family protein [Acidimicrobiia bacterium]
MTLVRRPIMLLGPAVILVVALALATNVLPLRQIVAQRTEIAATQATLDTILAENGTLDAQVSALETPLEVERLAREELGYVRPGERAYVVMDPNLDDRSTSRAVGPASVGDTGQATVEQPEPNAATERHMLARMWDYVTGRDLAGAE